MTNLTGRTLSHYRLEAKIGAGGMGEVYRGIDTRLDRPVAVKVLSSDLLRDEDRKRRFAQEARAASALNHPNIVTIHDVGSEAGTDFIVMEHVDGKTLEEIIGRRPMTLGPLLRHATQIADALTTAHAAGIVHRDLKPTNVMVTGQGLIKVLDFGLAKLAEVAAPADEQTRTVARGASPTERGVIVGTASYMSPEQAEGGVVDARSDIFSFGSMLYEMATGRRAFDGGTTMSTIAAVLRDEPPRISTITAPLPHDLEVLINRCLKKDPSRRVQHMADLKVALQELKDDSESGRLTTPVAPVPAQGRGMIKIAALTAVLAIVAVAAMFVYRRSPAAAPSSTELTRLTFDAGMTLQPTLSPDGKLVAYVSDRATKLPNIFVQQIDSGQAVQLTSHESGAVSPTFSPDGTRIAYFIPSGKEQGVYVVSTIGGDPRRVVSGEAYSPRFSPDGSQLSYVIEEGAFGGRLMVVAATGGPPARVGGDFLPVSSGFWSPDGSHLLAAGRTDRKARAADYDWFAVSVKDGTIVRTGAAAALRGQKLLPEAQAVPSPDEWSGGSVLFTLRRGDAANVWRIAVNPTTFQVEGPAEQLTSGTTAETSPTMSRDGKLAFAAVDTIQDYWALPIDANAATVKGPRTQIMKNSASDGHFVTPDGTTLFYCSHRGGQSEIRSRNLVTGKETLLMTAPTTQHVGGVTADGATYLYYPPTDDHVRFLATTSGAPPRKICEGCNFHHMSDDGSKLLFVTPPDYRTFRVLDIASGQSRVLFSSATKEFRRGQISPDGQWAALGTIDGKHLVLVPMRDSPVDEKEATVIGPPSSNGRYDMIRFSPDGNTIYYLSDEDGHTCIYAQRFSATKQPAGAPVVVQHLHEANTFGHPHGMRVGADKLVLLMNQGSSNVWLMQSRR